MDVYIKQYFKMFENFQKILQIIQPILSQIGCKWNLLSENGHTWDVLLKSSNKCHFHGYYKNLEADFIHQIYAPKTSD